MRSLEVAPPSTLALVLLWMQQVVVPVMLFGGSRET